MQFLIAKKVPDGIKISESARQTLESQSSVSFEEQHEGNSDLRLELTQLQCQYKCAQIEIEYFKSLNEELKKGSE